MSGLLVGGGVFTGANESATRLRAGRRYP
jgi:hypothetical protein